MVAGYLLVDLLVGTDDVGVIIYRDYGVFWPGLAGYVVGCSQMLQCRPDGLFGHFELFCEACTARNQLPGPDGNALPLLFLPVCGQQQVEEQPGSIRLGVPFPVSQTAGKGNKATRWPFWCG